MKTHLLLAITFLLLFACKKDKKTDESDYIPHGNQLKKARTILPVTNGKTVISNSFYDYDPFGKLIKITQIDSAFENQVWTVKANVVNTFSYSTFNKISEKQQYQTLFKYTYDSVQTLKYFTIGMGGGLFDTINYVYSNSLITSSLTRSYFKDTEIKYYSTNLDSVYTFDSTQVLISKTHYHYNANQDLTRASLNNMYTVPENKNELLSVNNISFNYNLKALVYSRVLDAQGFAIMETRTHSDGLTFTTYFYY
jgi:hypothetical protein